MKRVFKPFPVDDLLSFKNNLLQLSRRFDRFCLLESNDYALYPHSNFGFFAAMGCLDEIENSNEEEFLIRLQEFHDRHKDWMFGYFSYDLKNQIEPQLRSENSDHVHCPPGYFFIPKYILRFDNGNLDLGVVEEAHRLEFLNYTEEMTTYSPMPSENAKPIILQPRISKAEYVEKVEGLKQHISRGDIYETNFCMEFFMEETAIDPIPVFEKLNRISKAPFGAFFQQGDLLLMCSSPERYLKKWQQEVISQPIKGTIRRGKNKTSDELLREALRWGPQGEIRECDDRGSCAK